MTDRFNPIVNMQNECSTLSRDIEISRREFAEGKGIPSEEVFREMDELIKGWAQ